MTVVRNLISAFAANREHLNGIDGALRNANHGDNLHAAFEIVRKKLDARAVEPTLPESLAQVAEVFLDGAGGAIGPVYGAFFLTLAGYLPEEVNRITFLTALTAAVNAVQFVVGTKPGEKTLVDTLVPALAGYRAALDSGASFAECLSAMAASGEAGRDATRHMQAAVGRAALHKENSIGSIDPGAASAALILRTLAESMGEV
jgi:dihydroxyacetone kinase-like protein